MQDLRQLIDELRSSLPLQFQNGTKREMKLFAAVTKAIGKLNGITYTIAAMQAEKHKFTNALKLRKDALERLHSRLKKLWPKMQDVDTDDAIVQAVLTQFTQELQVSQMMLDVAAQAELEKSLKKGN